MNIIRSFAYDPQDNEDIRLEKSAIFIVAGSCTVAGMLWTFMYYLVFGWGLITFLPLSFVIIVGAALIFSHITRKHEYAIYAQIICIMYVTTFIQWRIGSIYDSGLVFVWAFIGPICALMFFSPRQSISWFVLYVINLIISVVFYDHFVSHGQSVDEHIGLFFYAMNLGVASAVVFSFAGYFVTVGMREKEKTNKLLQTNLQQELTLRENEKLATLGRLSAGVAHELNNPAAAAQRGTQQLKMALAKLQQSSLEFVQFQLTDKQMHVIHVQTQIVQRRAHEPMILEPLERSDQEYAIEEWLEQHSIDDAWELAPMLVSAGYTTKDLDTLKADFSTEEFPSVARVLGHAYTLYSILEEIGQGTGRIAEIVKALKSYSYLDQAPTQSIDVHEGLNNTLVMLNSKLKKGIQIHREYAPDLPKIEAFGSELNQVWTNIIDNAIDAMDGRGEITIRTSKDAEYITVEIIESGPGIPQDVQSKVFDPFFTTKPLGVGTGLGLNISYNIIVQKHKGKITVDSQPGATCFAICLPIDYEYPQQDN